jgi:hypothetical protein
MQEQGSKLNMHSKIIPIQYNIRWPAKQSCENHSAVQGSLSCTIMNRQTHILKLVQLQEVRGCLASRELAVENNELFQATDYQ